MNADKTGKLVSIGRHNLGASQRYEYFRCVDCGTDYPAVNGFAPSCNHHEISRCPYCSPTSKPWTNGRGP